MFRLLLISGILFFLAYRFFFFLSKHFRGNRNRQGGQRYDNPPQDDSKHFTKDIGEYVSYEEVKDEDKKE